MTELERMKNLFDDFGVHYSERTHDVDEAINPKHTWLYVEEFVFIFDKKSGIFFDTRNLNLD